jgi:hypothetical protein
VRGLPFRSRLRVRAGSGALVSLSVGALGLCVVVGALGLLCVKFVVAGEWWVWSLELELELGFG